MRTMELTQRDIYRAIRKRKGIKLKEISKQVGCAISTLSDYERGMHMSMEKVIRYREYIDTYEYID